MTINHRSDTRASRRVLKASFVAGTMLALLIGCSTSADGVDDAELGTAQAAITSDPCMMDPTAYGCEQYDPPSGTTTSPGAATLNTSTWTISIAGWTISATQPVYWGSGSDPNMADSHLHATITATRSSTAPDAKQSFGAAIVRAINKPGGTTSTPCTRNSECYANGIAAPNADGSFNYCGYSGGGTNKTCMQRPGPPIPNWQTIVTGAATAWAPGESRTFQVPNNVSGSTTIGAPFGAVTGVVGPNWDNYSIMVALNVVSSVSYVDPSTGATKSAPPCQLYNVTSPNGVSYEEDPAYCFKMTRPFGIYQKWACGDGTCGGTETQSSCPGDCQPPPPEYFCGDGICNNGETATTCKCDCNQTCLMYPYKCNC